MRVIREPVRPGIGPDGGTCVSIGIFDGVHLGHRRLLAAAVDSARRHGLTPVVLTFDPHPLEVLGRNGAPDILTDMEEKAALIEALGVEVLWVVPFTTDFSRLEAEAFIRSVLVEGMGVRRVVVGYNFTFGYRAAGKPELLDQVGPRFGFQTEVLGPVRIDGEIVSSTSVREAIRAADLIRAELFLGRPYGLRGTVVRGEGRGRQIGFPTANLEVDPRRCLPPHGVYAVRARVGGAEYRGVANLGVRPTFGGERETFEVHFLDFDADLYDAEVGVSFVTRLRPERRFQGVAALRAQIAEDVAQARRILGSG